ncbi:MAG TPA: efflux RND transporter permease subunit, partial [Phycisphaeraceae bacterium]|nr:efflux RND transporter permease subunit [Phycisphaeraceae bacterium]
MTLGLGWRESLVVAVAVPVVFGLALFVNLLAGYTINRVTLFALILSLGLLVDDPIVDVENISRHFAMRGRATRGIVLEAVAEIRPPLITATLAVIVSFLPLFYLTGMMGPYMKPMALNVPVTMIMSMVVAFTITPWLSYHVLRRRKWGTMNGEYAGAHSESAEHDIDAIKRTKLFRAFSPIMRPFITRKSAAIGLLLVITLLTILATGLAAMRSVPLKMLPFGNKNQLQLVLDFDEGTTLERANAAVMDFEREIAAVPEVVDLTSYVGIAGPMDFNGMVRHYYLRQGQNVAEIQFNLAGKLARPRQAHEIALAIRNRLEELAKKYNVNLKIVESPPGPPVIATVVAEVYGKPDLAYSDIINAAKTVRTRLDREPGVADLDDSVESSWTKLVFVTDKEKAAINGVSVAEIARTLHMALGGTQAGIVHKPGERNPLNIVLRLSRPLRSNIDDLSRVHVKGRDGHLVSLAELGQWKESTVEPTIFHKNLRRVVYVFAEAVGRAPAEVVIDVGSDMEKPGAPIPSDGTSLKAGWISGNQPRPLKSRTFLKPGGGIPWALPAGAEVTFAGEGEWSTTLDVFRDLGLAFAAALVAIYILLVIQTSSFVIPIVVMLAIPLTFLGIMPGFWLLNMITGGLVGGYANPIFFTATAMIGMIALAGIVTRQSVILVDFIHLILAEGNSLVDAILTSCVVRLRPILLTAGAAMLSAVPITTDPIFSGLAWALIFGLIAATVFSLFVIPVAYWLIYANTKRHGLPDTTPDDLA